jgi:transcriptional regulator of acetoin/glycerol metabolism
MRVARHDAAAKPKWGQRAPTVRQGFGRRVMEIMPEAIDALLRHDWPGNVRELRHVIERAPIVSEDGRLRPEDLSLWSTAPAQVNSTHLEVIERRTVERVMRETNGNKVQASRRLGISRMQLYGRLRKYGLEPRAVEAPDSDVAHSAPTY